eukprot:469164-Alexandrium_andersonii.AAC.1
MKRSEYVYRCSAQLERDEEHWLGEGTEALEKAMDAVIRLHEHLARRHLEPRVRKARWHGRAL